MILPIPSPPQGQRKIKPPRWDRYHDEPVPGDYWGVGPGDSPAQAEETSEEPQRIH